jgi:hypothetical protein
VKQRAATSSLLAPRIRRRQWLRFGSVRIQTGIHQPFTSTLPHSGRHAHFRACSYSLARCAHGHRRETHAVASIGHEDAYLNLAATGIWGRQDVPSHDSFDSQCRNFTLGWSRPAKHASHGACRAGCIRCCFRYLARLTHSLGRNIPESRMRRHDVHALQGSTPWPGLRPQKTRNGFHSIHRGSLKRTLPMSFRAMSLSNEQRRCIRVHPFTSGIATSSL